MPVSPAPGAQHAPSNVVGKRDRRSPTAPGESSTKGSRWRPPTTARAPRSASRPRSSGIRTRIRHSTTSASSPTAQARSEKTAIDYYGRALRVVAGLRARSPRDRNHLRSTQAGSPGGGARRALGRSVSLQPRDAGALRRDARRGERASRRRGWRRGGPSSATNASCRRSSHSVKASRAQGRDELADSILEQALEVDPNVAELHFLEASNV